MKPSLALSALGLVLLAGCASQPTAPAFSQSALPDAVKVPAGHTVAMELVGVGKISYECREKSDAKGTFSWVFVGPNAVLNNRAGTTVGRYVGPPATWASNDGSSLTGTQVAVAPSAPDSIPLQLVKTNPAVGQGALTGMTYIQRVATKGGIAPAVACGAANKGKSELVDYQADYIFYKAQ